MGSRVRGVGWGRVVRCWFHATLLALGLVAAGAAPTVAADRAFSVRFSADDFGDITVAANTTLTCPTAEAGCAAGQAGGAANNNSFTMSYVDADSDAATFDSSSAALSLPAGSTVLFAGLYWGGDTSAGVNGAAAPSAAARSTVRFTAPGAAVATVNGSVDDSTAAASRYQGFADVTADVKAAGSGSYTVGNVQSGTGQDRYGGWALVVAYRNLADPARNLTVFDGLTTVSGASPTADIPVSGFVTPPSGPVNTTLGFIAWEGDRGLTGDAAALDATTLTDAANPANNFFNSSVADLGTNVTSKTPNFANELGVDADLIDASGILANGASSATIHLTTGGETYLPGVVTFATELFAPRVTPQKTATDLNGGLVEPGDVIRYSITATNTGDDAADNVTATDPVPAHTTYVPGSLQIVSSPGGIAGAQTDAAGDDQAERGGGSVTFRVGAGANAGSGGTLAIGESYEVSFDVRVDAGTANGTVIQNQATTTYTAAANSAFDLTEESTPPTRVTVSASRLHVTKTADVTSARAGSTVSYTLRAAVTGAPATSVVACDRVPAHMAVADLGGGTLAGGRVCWQLGTIAAGSAKSRRLVLRIDQDAPSGPLRNVLVVRAANAATARDRATVDASAAPGSVPVVTG